MKLTRDRTLAFVFGAVFIVALLVLSILVREPTTSQFLVFRVVLALASAGIGGTMPGLLQLNLKAGTALTFRGGGALALFVIIFFFNPGQFAVARVVPEEEYLASLPVFEVASDSSVTWSQTSQPSPGEVMSMDPVAKLVIDGISLSLPNGAVLRSEKIIFQNGAELRGPRFAVIARELSNARLKANGSTASDGKGESGGEIWVFAKTTINSVAEAEGGNGRDGTPGPNGVRGNDGTDGRDGKCGGFGAYRGARPGGDGGNGQNGLPGTDGGDAGSGGRVTLLTTRNQPQFQGRVEPGVPGKGGLGGRGGQGGRAGKGGSGCTGLGGSQSNEPSGRPGLPGENGPNGEEGRTGQKGIFEQKVLSHDEFVEQARQFSFSDHGSNGD